MTQHSTTKYWWFLLCTLILELAESTGPLCLACSHISRPLFCDHVDQCGDHQVCHVQRIRTKNGYDLYTSGCIDNSTCAHSSHPHKRLLLGDHEVHGQIECFECCEGPLCNNKGCGDPGPLGRDRRGPFCFQCDRMVDPRECERVTLCQADEVCAVEEYLLGVFGQEFSSGCKSKATCNRGGVQPLLGKRHNSRYFQVNLCDYCCSGDYCNSACAQTHEVHNSTVSTPIISTMTSSSPMVSSHPSQTTNHTFLTSNSTTSQTGPIGATYTTLLSNNTAPGPTGTTPTTLLSTTAKGTSSSSTLNNFSSSSANYSTPDNSNAGNNLITISLPVIHGNNTLYTTLMSQKTSTASFSSNFTMTTIATTLSSIPNSFTTIPVTHTTTGLTTFPTNSTTPLVISSPQTTTPVPAKAFWAPWSEFSPCMSQQKCSVSNQTRTRACIQSSTNSVIDVTACVGQSSETRLCSKGCKDCKTLHNLGFSKDGIYDIEPDNFGEFPVYCDMQHGGWIVIQRRTDGQQDFDLFYSDYVQGFGNLSGEFWLGLNKINRLSNLTNPHKLNINLTTDAKETAYIVYSVFGIGDSNSGYKLFVDHKSEGNISEESFSSNNKQEFATFDHDNKFGCGNARHGGWWFNNCAYMNLNGKYGLKNDYAGFVERKDMYRNLISSLMEII